MSLDLNKRFEFFALFYFVCNLLFFMNPVNGLAGSLENLQNEISNETGYEKELEDYMSSHNMTFGINEEGKPLTIDDFGLSEMEEIVKSHMEYCQTTNASERVKKFELGGTEWGIFTNDKFVGGNC